MPGTQSTLIALVFIVLALDALARGSDDLPELPVDRKALERLTESSGGRYNLTNLFSLRQIYDAVRDGGTSGLEVDFSHVTELLDGAKLDPGKLYGSVLAGPYPFESRESRFSYKRFRIRASISAGKARIDLPSLLEPRLNSEGWTDRGQLAVRFILLLEGPEKDRDLGTYDTVVAFEKTRDGFAKRPGIVEGPFVNLVSSDAPGEAVISFLTHESVRARVIIEDGEGRTTSYWDEWARERHEIPITGLRPGERFTYRLEVGGTTTRPFELRAAPPKSRGAAVRFAYFGDSRAGEGGGLMSYMGVNYNTLERHARLAHAGGAEFFIVGGDLVSGYTTVPDDFEAQLHAWKQAVTGFWNERPIYAGMGNHDALLRRYTSGLRIDRWPYDTESAEAVFARVFVHPRNGPLPSDPRRPTYRENVYSFHYGCVKVIAFNNNYWFSDNSRRYGGSPEGYIMNDQLEWIEAELERAEDDPEVRYVILFAQEPVFPNGGHLGDAMWHDGDNRVRAYVHRDGKVLPEEDGVVVVRNRFVRSVAARRKVAAVLGSDEHAYHRLLIGPEVPIGDIERDDRNLNGQIDVDAGETASPLGDLRHRTWYIVCGGGGAPYYAGEKTPWNEHWRDRAAPRSGVPGYFYSSQENVLLFDAGEGGIGVRVYNPHGELIDEIPDLMADKE